MARADRVPPDDPSKSRQGQTTSARDALPSDSGLSPVASESGSIERTIELAPWTILLSLLVSGAIAGLGAFLGRWRAPLVVQLGVPSAVMALWTVWFAVFASARRQALRIEIVRQRSHVVQMLAQACVFAYWATGWDLVRPHLLLLLAQVLFAYHFEALVAFTRRRTWTFGFGVVPIVLGVNLFLWFKDEAFGAQFLMIALALASKEFIRWNRDGVSRPIFNPAAIALSVAGIVLMASRNTALTYGFDIAQTQEFPWRVHEALFLILLIVQVNVPVVLISASAVVAMCAYNAIFTAIFGTYLFGATSLPVAVLLGMTLLVTEPETSPTTRTGRVLFGALYALAVFAIYPLLERSDTFGYYDKILCVPLLNLCVRPLDRLARAIVLRSGALAQRARFLYGHRYENHVNLAIWAVVVATILLTNRVGEAHPGREVAFWRKTCDERKVGACRRLASFYGAACIRGQGDACHNLGVMLQSGDGIDVDSKRANFYFARGCERDVPQSCGAVANVMERVGGELGTTFELMRRACEGGSGASCHNLAVAFKNGTGVPQDEKAAINLFDRGCEAGVLESCNSLAALSMLKNGKRNPTRALNAFRSACEGGDGAGCANLGTMLLIGDGVAPDPKAAADANRTACERGIGQSCARLAGQYRAGKGVPVDVARAYELDSKACAAGVATSCGPGGK